MLQPLLDQLINPNLISLIISNSRKKETEIFKIKVRPIALDQTVQYQVESFTATQAFHTNFSEIELKNHLLHLYAQNLYKQMDFYTTIQDHHLLINKKRGIHMSETPPTQVHQSLSHNRKKQYLLEEGHPIPFLIHLGIMTKEGKVVQKKYDKFRQINRYLEMVEDILPHLSYDQPLRIIDFGCGKSYLTFALYHYLVHEKNYIVQIVGLDLKEEVIHFCNQLATDLHYANLSFQIGDIGDYQDTQPVDMVITLHACDTATDFALQKAVAWNAKVIMSVPCCQHELNSQIVCAPLKEVLKYGIIKERISALLTDAMRANWLELKGYDVQILEFIDLEHTPKNLLIRAIKNNCKIVPLNTWDTFADLEAFIGSDLFIKRCAR